MCDSGNDHLKGCFPMEILICQVLENQFKQYQDGELPVTGSSPIKVWLHPELRKALIDSIHRRLIYGPEQRQHLERELDETRAMLVEFTKCIRNAQTDIEYVNKMIRSAALTLESHSKE